MCRCNVVCVSVGAGCGFVCERNGKKDCCKFVTQRIGLHLKIPNQRNVGKKNNNEGYKN